MTNKYTQTIVDGMKEQLAESEWEGLKDKDLKQILWDGCVGWNNMTDEEVVEQYEDIYGEVDVF